MAVRYDPARGIDHGAKIGLVRVRDYVLKRWGGLDVGIYNPRKVRGGSSWSLHAEGRAFDWNYPDDAALDEALAFFIANAEALQVQSITDYRRSRRWQSGKGWKPWTGWGSGPNGVHTWHLERNWVGALDGRRIETIVAPPAPPPPPLEPPGPVAWKDVAVENLKHSLVELNLDGVGNGWRDVNPRLGRPPVVIGVVLHGPHPPSDGYWHDNSAPVLAAQVRGDSVILSVSNGKPNTKVRAFLAVA